MKKIILLLLFVVIFTCGCSSPFESDQEIINKKLDTYLICIDGVQYIMIQRPYNGYLSPHLTSDKFNNPKVIKCEVEK